MIPIPYSDDSESIPQGEASKITRIVEIARQTLEEHFQRTGERVRDVHVKAHGCVRGEFRVADGLPDELAQGLFARQGVYPAVARFSNSSPWRQPDAIPDGRGMAIQIENVPQVPGNGPPASLTQDFLMVNAPAFIARDVSDYLRLEEDRLAARDRPMGLAVRLAGYLGNPLQRRWRALRSILSVASQLPGHPASYTYFSMVPIRFGRFVAKYRVFTARPSTLRIAKLLATHKDALRLALLESMRADELRFQFQVQLRTSDVSMPIEDATVEWPESESPYRTVAEFVVPPQDILKTEASEACERRSFSVWNCLPDHRPLGGINRIRKAVYEASVAFRCGASAQSPFGATET